MEVEGLDACTHPPRRHQLILQARPRCRQLPLMTMKRLKSSMRSKLSKALIDILATPANITARFHVNSHSVCVVQGVCAQATHEHS